MMAAASGIATARTRPSDRRPMARTTRMARLPIDARRDASSLKGPQQRVGFMVEIDELHTRQMRGRDRGGEVNRLCDAVERDNHGPAVAVMRQHRLQPQSQIWRQAGLRQQWRRASLRDIGEKSVECPGAKRQAGARSRETSAQHIRLGERRLPLSLRGLAG